MKIILLTGESGVGKSSIAKELEQISVNYQILYSFTTRKERTNDFGDHIFINKDWAITYLKNNSEYIVAQTIINDEFYFTSRDQFKDNKTNIYIVDSDGLKQTLDYFQGKADITSFLITRKNVNIDLDRQDREITIPNRSEVDYCIWNDGKLKDAAFLIHFIMERGSSYKIQDKTDEEINNILKEV